jgi:hypothetical protein
VILGCEPSGQEVGDGENAQQDRDLVGIPRAKQRSQKAQELLDQATLISTASVVG